MIHLWGATPLVFLSGLLLWFPYVSADEGAVMGTIAVQGKTRLSGPTGAQDVVVYLDPVEKREWGGKGKPAVIDQLNHVFLPHVTAIQVGTAVEFLNSDPADHNVYSPDKCCSFDLGNFGKGVKKSYTFKEKGEAVLLCKLHPEMSAYVIIVDTPYFTITKVDPQTKSGGFRIDGVLPGTYTVRTWNKKLKAAAANVTVTSGQSASVHFDLGK